MKPIVPDMYVRIRNSRTAHIIEHADKGEYIARCGRRSNDLDEVEPGGGLTLPICKTCQKSWDARDRDTGRGIIYFKGER